MALPEAILWILSTFLIAVTLLPFVRKPKWWIRVWDYPRLQVAAGLSAAAIAQAGLLSRSPPSNVLLVVTLGCLLWQAGRITPYTRLHAEEVLPADRPDPANTLSVMVSNVLQDNRMAEAFLRRIDETDPDLVLAVETDEWWDGQIAGLLERYPHAVRHPLDNTYGMHLFSRLELGDVKLQDRVSPGIPSIFARVRLRSGTLVNLHCVHPEPPQIGNDVYERDAELLLVAKEVAGDRRPTIVCGDLNDVAWSHTTRLFRRISGLIDPRIGRGLYPTFHAGYRIARWPLDHIFHDAGFRLKRIEVLESIGSDHFPILVQLVHDPAAVHEQEVPEADAEDRKEAVEKIGDGREAAREEFQK
jgi:endonuclease/exonuclease/phosphatase (EEP) superfamily protein YafD